MSVHAADLDSDADVDVLSASSSGNVVAWHENSGAVEPTWNSHDIATVADVSSPQSVYAADLNGDNALDALSAARFAGQFVWHENSGATNPSWTSFEIDAGAGNDSTATIHAGDLDGDGDVDVVGGSGFPTNTFSWYENDGSWTKTVIDTEVASPTSVQVVDLDLDGDLDILAGSYTDDTVAWYENDGASEPTFAKDVVSTTSNGPWSVYAADLNGDGYPDILSASYYDDSVTWYEHDGNASPNWSAATISSTALGARAVHAADVDDDGDLDVLVASQTNNTVALYENDGAATPSFSFLAIDTGASGAYDVSAADMDGDGDLDILAALYGSGTVVWYENNHLGSGDDDDAGDDDDTGDDDATSACLSVSTQQGMDFVKVCGGTFEMGCTAAQQSDGRCGADESPAHDVTLSRDFWMGETEVTQSQWEAVMGNNPSHFSASGAGGDCGAGCPVESVNWWEAVSLANQLSSDEGLASCYELLGCSGTAGVDLDCTGVTVTSASGSPYDCQGYRLPTEAEWEYAARAGTDLLYAGSDTVGDVAWYSSNSSSSTHEVAQKAANGWGLYDMSGNVWEWAWDWYESSYYSGSPSTDPEGPSSGSDRVRRGGGWNIDAYVLRVSDRPYSIAGDTSADLGLRLARTVPVDGDGDGVLMHADCDDSDALVGVCWQALTGGNDHFCARRSDGGIQCWGHDNHDQITGTPTGTGYAAVDAGGYHACALSGGQLQCWGAGSPDDPVNTWPNYAQSVPPSDAFEMVSAAFQHTCGVKSDRSILCWGLQDGSFRDLGQVTDAPTTGVFQSVSGGLEHTCALTTDGAVQCWGSDEYNQMSGAPSGTGYTAISAGHHFTCAITSTGNLECWGRNNYGQLDYAGVSTFQSIHSGGDHGCGVTSSGSLECWGRDTDGQSSPPPGTFLVVAASGGNTCGLHTNRQIECWGMDLFGESSPPAIDPLTTDDDADGASESEGDCDDTDPAIFPGSDSTCPGTSCLQLLDDGHSSGDGTYWLDPDGSGAFEAYCDMTTDGGGWTLVGMVHPADYPNSVDEEYTWFRDGNNASYLPTYDPEWNQEPSSFGTPAFLAYLDSQPAPVARFHLVSNATPTESQTWFKGAPAAAFSEWFADDVTPTQVCDDVGMSSNCTAPTTIAWPGCGGCSLELGMALTNHGIAGSIHTRFNDVGEGPNTYAGVLTNAGSSGPWSYGGHELTIWIH